jgi:hypothetical protein
VAAQANYSCPTRLLLEKEMSMFFNLSALFSVLNRGPRHTLSAGRRRPAPTSQRARPVIEALEDRVLLAHNLLYIGTSANWSTKSAWIDMSDFNNYVPVAGDSLTFDPSKVVNGTRGTNSASTDDINALSVLNLTIASGYTKVIDFKQSLTVTGNVSMQNGDLEPLMAQPALSFTGASGVFNWTGGTIGIQVTLAGGGTQQFNIDGQADKTLKALITNAAKATWTNGNIVFSGLNADFSNAAGGTFEIKSGGNMSVQNASATFTNAGTFKKTAGGTNTIVVDMSNSGTMEFDFGTVAFTGVLKQTAGTAVTTLNGGNFSTAQTFQISFGTLNGVGTITGSIQNIGGTVTPGLNGAPGTLNITGTYEQDTGGTLTIVINAAGAFGKFNVQGSATLDGTLQVNKDPAFQPTPGQGFDTLAFMTYSSVNGIFSTVNITNNSWTVNGQEHHYFASEAPTEYDLDLV